MPCSSFNILNEPGKVTQANKRRIDKRKQTTRDTQTVRNKVNDKYGILGISGSPDESVKLYKDGVEWGVKKGR